MEMNSKILHNEEDKGYQANFDALDVVKATMAVVIIAIHFNPFREGCIYPIARIAVPLFFVMSSFFFFQKYENVDTEKKEVLQRFVMRNGQLYLFWLCVQLPVVVYRKRYLIHGLSGLKIFLRNILFGSTFTASWYIAALVIGTLIVCLLSRLAKDWQIMMVGCLLYLICCLDSNYSGWKVNFPILEKLLNFYPGNIYNSFPVSVLWVAIGKLFAVRKLKSNRNLPLVFVSLLALIGEHFLINSLGLSSANDCYLMLIPVVITIFALLISLKIRVLQPKSYRRYSTIAFCSHGTIGWIINAVVMRTVPQFFGGAIVFLLTVITTVFLYHIIDALSRRHWILKYAF